jgi:hypothetical protein
VDTSYYSYWLSTLSAYGFTHTYPSSDPVHFDYMASTDLAKVNLKAFQTLYNKYAGGKLTVDGIYGSATASALYNSPCGGW